MKASIGLIFLVLTLFFLPLSSSIVTDNWSASTFFNETWQSLGNWTARDDPHVGEYGNTTVVVNADANMVRLQAICNSSTNWYGVELKSNTAFNLSKEYIRLEWSFATIGWNYSNRYAFSFTFWNGTFADNTTHYATEVEDWAKFFRVETINETHANYQIPLQWNQTTNPLPYTGEYNVTCILSQNTQSWYINNVDWGTGLVGGLGDGYTEAYLYLALEVYGDQTYRYIDFGSITISSHSQTNIVSGWDFSSSQNWELSSEPVLSANSSFTIHNDPSIIQVNDTYYMAYSVNNGTYSETQLMNGSSLFVWDQVIATFPDSVKPWLSNLQSDGYFYIFYSIAGGICNRSRSVDLISWDILQAALNPSANEWDASGNFASYLIYKSPSWYLFYYGTNSTDPVDRIGFATASALNGTFSKYDGNPVMSPTKLSSFTGEYGCLSSTIVKSGNYYYNLYNTYTLEPRAVGQERGIMTINVARSSDLINWDYLGYPMIKPDNLGWDWKTLIGSSSYFRASNNTHITHYLFVNAFNQSQHENIGYYSYTESAFIQPWVPYLFILGMIGLGSMFCGTLYVVHLFKKGEYKWALVQGVTFLSIGFGLFIAWVFA